MRRAEGEGSVEPIEPGVDDRERERSAGHERVRPAVRTDAREADHLPGVRPAVNHSQTAHGKQ